MTLEVSDRDRSALTALVYDYAAGVDDRRPAAVAELFVEDGTLAVPADPRRAGDVLVHRGRAAVEAVVADMSRLHLTFHAVVGVELTPGENPDEIGGRVACIAHHVLPPGEDGRAVDDVWHLVYRDRYVRTCDGWRIARRELGLGFRTTDTVRVPQEP